MHLAVDRSSFLISTTDVISSFANSLFHMHFPRLRVNSKTIQNCLSYHRNENVYQDDYLLPGSGAWGGGSHIMVVQSDKKNKTPSLTV